jgi:hypothetical protein
MLIFPISVIQRNSSNKILKIYLVFTRIFNFVKRILKLSQALFHSYLPFLDFSNQVNMHFFKSNYVDLIETNFIFIHILSLVVVYWHALEKTWPKQVL